jgi:lysophospholipase L1-like esterase
VANDVIARNPNIVVVAGGFNDGAFSNTEIATEAGLMFNQIVDALPDVRLLVVSPFYPDTATSTIINRGLAIADQIPSGPHHHYIDVLTPSIITGTGDQDDNHNDGNADRYIGGDHVHPTFAGHQYMGRRIASIIQHTAL